MKRVFGLLYFAFPAVLLLAQTSRPARPDSLPKSFPPEMISYPPATQVKVSHSNCVHRTSDGKSLFVNRCESVPAGISLIAPFTVATPKKPAK